MRIFKKLDGSKMVDIASAFVVYGTTFLFLTTPLPLPTGIDKYKLRASLYLCSYSESSLVAIFFCSPVPDGFLPLSTVSAKLACPLVLLVFTIGGGMTRTVLSTKQISSFA